MDAFPELARLFALQRAHRWTYAHTTAAERRERLDRLAQSIERHRAALCEAMAADFRKSEVEVELTELAPTLMEIRHLRSQLARWMKPRRASTPVGLFGMSAHVRYEPRGQVLVLAPWNYPINLLLIPLATALAAGNVVIARPSEKVPRTAEVLAKVVRDALDEREAAVVVGDVPLADALLEQPFDHIFFTGSTRVGKKVMEKAAAHLASVTLELGGKSPVVIHDSADLALTAARVAWGKFINGGQTCVAPDYVLVPERLKDRFVEALGAAIRTGYGATPEQVKASPDLCRLVDDGAFRRLSSLLGQAVAAGATVALGGEQDPQQRFLAPTVVTDVAWDSPLMADELFGPILPVLTYTDLDAALAEIRARPKPLALYVFAQDAAAADHVLRHTTAGGTVVNNTILHLAHPNLPFGGVNSSGHGSYHGEAGFRCMSHERSVLVHRFGNLVSRLYPPYGATTRQMLGMMQKLMG
jgi:aldehyde dehydrogenase (NAD+)